MLQSMGWQRVRLNCAVELNSTTLTLGRKSSKNRGDTEHHSAARVFNRTSFSKQYFSASGVKWWKKRKKKNSRERWPV